MLTIAVTLSPESLLTYILSTLYVPVHYTIPTTHQRTSKTMGLCSSSSTDINELSPDEKAQIAEDMGAEVENIVRIYSIQYIVNSCVLSFILPSVLLVTLLPSFIVTRRTC